jgi:hypothetical protein
MNALTRSALCLAMASMAARGEDEPKSLIYSGFYQNGAFDSLTFVNEVVGWNTFLAHPQNLWVDLGSGRSPS